MLALHKLMTWADLQTNEKCHIEKNVEKYTFICVGEREAQCLYHLRVENGLVIP